MDVRQILEQLIQERDQIEEAILSLERLVAGLGKRRGPPPGTKQPKAQQNLESVS
jgi:hypothetical protein